MIHILDNDGEFPFVLILRMYQFSGIKMLPLV